MRASNRDRILDGVIRIIERDGMTAVTFDAVAAETGLTRGGLIYHFPSREDLLRETHRRLARRWEAELEGLAGPGVSAAERHAAYVQGSLRGANRAELLLMLEAAADPELAGIWAAVLDRWAPPVPQPGDEAGMIRFLARMAADGIWAHEITAGRRLPQDVRERAGQAVSEMLRRS